MTKKTSLFISCGIFKEELTYLLKEKGFEGEVVFLDAALHVNFDRLKAKLEEALAEHRPRADELNVVYGHCHPEMQEIIDRHGAKRIAAGNCLEALLGKEELERLSGEKKTFFLSAGWINNWEKMFEQGREDFGHDFRSMFASHERIVILDAGVLPLDEEKIRRFSDYTGLPVERKAITLDHLLCVIKRI